MIFQRTLGDKLNLSIDFDPSVTGLAAPIGSTAQSEVAGVAKFWLKNGAGNNGWIEIATGSVDLSPYFKHDGSVPMTGSMMFGNPNLMIDFVQGQRIFANQKNLEIISQEGIKLSPSASYAVDVSNRSVANVRTLEQMISASNTANLQYLAWNSGARRLTVTSTEDIVAAGYKWIVVNGVLYTDLLIEATVTPNEFRITFQGAKVPSVLTATSSLYMGSGASVAAFELANFMEVSAFDQTTKPVVKLKVDSLSVGAVIRDVVDPSLAQDAATKNYVDTEIAAIPAVDLTPYFKKDGSVPMEGDIVPDATGTRQLGTNALKFLNLYLSGSMSVSSGGYNTQYNRDGIIADVGDFTVNANGSNANIVLAPSGTGAVDLSTKKIKNLANPTADQDASTKKYTDDADALLIPLAQKGAVSGVAPLDASQKIPNQYLPALAITDTYVVASEVAMLALNLAEKGDVAVRTDLSKSFILVAEPYSDLGNWQELLTPTQSVLSVNGQTGAVVLTTTDIAEGTNLYFTAPRAVSAALASEKLWIAGDLASELNVATGIKYFGTKSGDFDIVFMRNNVERMRLDGTNLIMPSNGGLNSDGNLNITSSTGNIEVSALGGNLTINGISINSSVRTRFQNHLELTTGNLLIRSYEQTKKLAVIDADATKTLVYGENLANKNKSIEMNIYFMADGGVHAFYKKTAHIDSTGALVISQDDMTSKSVAAALLDVQVSYAGGNLTLSFSGMAGMTNKNCVVQYREEGAF